MIVFGNMDIEKNQFYNLEEAMYILSKNNFIKSTITYSII